MQKLHTVLAWLLLALLAVHITAGVVVMLTETVLSNTMLSFAFMALVGLHAVLALWKMVRHKGLRELFAYRKLNRGYWARVLSGLGILVLAPIHQGLWVEQTPFGLLPKSFGVPSLTIQLLFCTVIAVHLVLNVKPLLMDTGLAAGRGTRGTLKILVLLLLLAAAAAAGAYFWGVEV